MRILSFDRSALSIGAAAAFLAGCGASHMPSATSPTGAAPLAFTHHITFGYTGKKQTFTVPSGVTHIRVSAVGANGGGSVTTHGGRVSAVIPVTPSETLAIYVGGAGSSAGGGFNGGDAGGPNSDKNGNGGGGASDVREGGHTLKYRVLVAGGAGGSGTGGGGRGGKGGSSTGGSGKHGWEGNTANGRKADLGGGGASGGSQDRGGAGGSGTYSNRHPGGSGELGSGGAGGTGCNPSSSSSGCGPPAGSGGGGGGGLYGGGGGGGGIFEGCCGAGGGGGGGGGSSYVESNATHVNMRQGWNQSQGGTVVLEW